MTELGALSVTPQEKLIFQIEDPFPTLYPQWLVNRKDFQDLRQQYERLDRIDVFSVCEKMYLQRSDFEKKAVTKLLKNCAFFSSMKDHQLLEVSDRMHSVRFALGDSLMTKGERADCLYMLVKGVVGIYVDDEDVLKSEVRDGNVVGETAVQTRNQRTATVKAQTPVEALRLTYEDYDHVIFRLKLQDFYEVANFLKSIDYFSTWNVSKLYRLASVIIVKHYKRGQRIYSTGEKAQDLYIVREGVVSLKIEVNLEKRNRWPIKAHEWTQVQTTHRYEKSLRDCSCGMFFGEHDLITRVPHTTNAICASESCLLFIIISDFFREVFSDKDCKCLYEINLLRPDTGHLRDELEREKRLIKVSSDAMLNAFNMNNLPLGRGLFLTQTDLKKAEWARFIVKKKQGDIRKDLIQLRKQETHLGFDEPIFRTFSDTVRNPL